MAPEPNAQPTASPADISDVRHKLGLLTEKVKTDAAFADQLKSDPAGTLAAQGLNENAIGEVLHHWNVEPEVEGHYIYRPQCFYLTDSWDVPCACYTI